MKLIGNGFPPTISPTPPDEILERATALCECGTKVLPGVPGFHEGKCYYCHGGLDNPHGKLHDSAGMTEDEETEGRRATGSKKPRSRTGRDSKSSAAGRLFD